MADTLMCSISDRPYRKLFFIGNTLYDFGGNMIPSRLILLQRSTVKTWNGVFFKPFVTLLIAVSNKNYQPAPISRQSRV